MTNTNNNSKPVLPKGHLHTKYKMYTSYPSEFRVFMSECHIHTHMCTHTYTHHHHHIDFFCHRQGIEKKIFCPCKLAYNLVIKLQSHHVIEPLYVLFNGFERIPRLYLIIISFFLLIRKLMSCCLLFISYKLFTEQ